MATLTVRNLEDDLVRRLRIRAAENGRSAEAEHREILRRALAPVDAAELERRREAMERLKEFARRTSGRGGPSVTELLHETRRERMRQLTGEAEEDPADLGD